MHHLVGIAGIEPATSRLSGERSDQLSYMPVGNVFVVVHCLSLSIDWLARFGITPVPSDEFFRVHVPLQSLFLSYVSLHIGNFDAMLSAPDRIWSSRVTASFAFLCVNPMR